MSIFKCKMCGGEINAVEGAAFGTCDSCGITSTLPKANDEKLVNLFNRANHFRRLNEFDKALAAYESILNEDNTNAEAHWCAVLCRYGIEYVEDPRIHERVPTCHRTQYASILTDADYLAALEYAEDSYTRGLYESEAERISEIQKGILAISGREEPFDVFICYKETTDGGSRTKDSTIAQDIYYQLTNEGYRVFFSKITLEEKLGQEYEPYIFAALNSAKVMLVIGTKAEHFNAVWVKNEWSRFLMLMKGDRSRLLIPCYRDMDAYDLPDELAMFQSQDMSKIGFMQDLVRGVKKVIDAEETKPASPSAVGTVSVMPGVNSLMKRGWLFLEDADWKQADEYFDKVLDIDAEYAPAYLGKLFAELEIRSENHIDAGRTPIIEYVHFQRALRFADASFRAKLDDIQKRFDAAVTENIQQEKQRVIDLQKRINMYKNCISAGRGHSIGLQTDGTVDTVGYRQYEYYYSEWYDIIAVSTGQYHSVGLKVDGTVVALRERSEYDHGQANTQEWRDIIAVSAGYNHTVGLRTDGSVVAVGKNKDGQCNVDGWRNIVAISASGDHTLGLKSNGTVVAVGNNESEQCDVENFRDIVMIAAGSIHTAVLKTDGTVAAVGNDSQGRCDVGQWQGIIMIAAGNHTVGLKNNGTVVAVGWNDVGQCDTSEWGNMIAVSAGRKHTVGLRKDGTVSTVGESGIHHTYHWKDIGPADKEKLKKAREKREQQRIESEQAERWREQGLCTYCGGKLSGLFTKTCKSCGEENDGGWLDRIENFTDNLTERMDNASESFIDRFNDSLDKKK